MKAIQDLFSTDYGLMSIGGIVIMVVGMVWAYAVLKAKMAEDAKNAGK
jgi:hypothetical protein